MTAVSWRDGAQELRRLLMAENGVPNRIEDVGLAWRAFRAFLAVPLDGLFDRWDSADVEADTLVVDFGEFGGEEDLPGLLMLRRFNVPSIEWHDVSRAFARGTTAEVDDFWTAVRSGGSPPKTWPRPRN